MPSIQIDRTDGLSSSTAFKGPCKATTTANIALYAEQTLDGVAVVTGDRVLVKNQTAGYENGIYVVDTGQWRRAKDFSRNDDVREGTQVLVANGTSYERSLWVVTTNDPIVVGTNAITFQQTIVSAAELEEMVAIATAAAAAAVAAATALPPLAANTMIVDNAAGTLRETKSFPQVRDILDLAVFVDTRTALKALDTTKDTNAYLKESGRQGHFLWVTGDFSALITADTQEGLYVKANAIASTAGAWVRVVNAQINASWFGVDFTGVANSATTVQAAINLAASLGAELYFPAGRVRLGSMISIPPSSRIVGPGKLAEYSAEGVTAKDMVFHIDHTGVGFQAKGRTGQRSIRGISTYRNQPVPGSGAFTPTANDWDFQFLGVYDVDMEDICLVNPTKGIQAAGDTTTGAGSGRIMLRRITGQPIQTGIQMRQCYDTNFLDEIEFWPFWNVTSTGLYNYIQANGVAIHFYRVDNPKIGRIFAFGYLQTMRVNGEPNDPTFPTSLPGGSVSKGYIDTLGCDATTCGILVDVDASNVNLTIDKFYAQGVSGISDLVIIHGNLNRVVMGTFEAGVVAERIAFINTANILECSRAYLYQWDLGGGAANEAINVAGTFICSGEITKGIGSASPLFGGAGVISANEWRSYTPTVTSSGGTITTVGAVSGKFRRIGKTVEYEFTVPITNNGTGAGVALMTLPLPVKSIAPGYGIAPGGIALIGTIQAGLQRVDYTTYNGGYPLATGATAYFKGQYETT
jgi:hypothetical protein